jgi:hypothetical protein
MRVQEIIRGILDLLDSAEKQEDFPKEIAQPQVDDISDEDFYNDDVRRFRQIVDLADQGEPTQYSNTPKEEYAGLDAVTTAAGGGPNKPKHVDDIRGNSFRIHGDN